MRKVYEKAMVVLSILFGGCLIALLIQKNIPALAFPAIVSIVLITAITGIHETTHLLQEKSRLAFDLTTPAVFDNFLVFGPKGETCAVFFSAALVIENFDLTEIRRSLSVLLKVLPKSLVLSVEWTTQNMCYVNFYFKVERENVLPRTREIIEHVGSSFGRAFSDIHILTGTELTEHLALGITGKIQRATIQRGDFVLLETDKTQSSIVAAKFDITHYEQLRELFSVDGIFRIILAVAGGGVHQVKMSPHMLIFTLPRGRRLPKIKYPDNIFAKTSAGIIIQNLGDILTRNLIMLQEVRVNFDEMIDTLVSFISICKSLSEAYKRIRESREEAGEGNIEWRRKLSQETQRCGLTMRSDVFVIIDGFPVRVDAEVSGFLFKVIGTGTEASKLEWITNKLGSLPYNKAKGIIFLVSSPTTASMLQEKIGRYTRRRKRDLKVFTTGEELEEFIVKITPAGRSRIGEQTLEIL